MMSDSSPFGAVDFRTAEFSQELIISLNDRIEKILALPVPLSPVIISQTVEVFDRLSQGIATIELTAEGRAAGITDANIDEQKEASFRIIGRLFSTFYGQLKRSDIAALTSELLTVCFRLSCVAIIAHPCTQTLDMVKSIAMIINHPGTYLATTQVMTTASKNIRMGIDRTLLDVETFNRFQEAIRFFE